jgi:hypothetical protein
MLDYSTHLAPCTNTGLWWPTDWHKKSANSRVSQLAQCMLTALADPQFSVAAKTCLLTHHLLTQPVNA